MTHEGGYPDAYLVSKLVGRSIYANDKVSASNSVVTTWRTIRCIRKKIEFDPRGRQTIISRAGPAVTIRRLFDIFGK